MAVRFAAVALFTLVSVTRVFAADFVVVDIKGRWMLRGEELRVYHRIVDGAKLTCDQPGYIEVVSDGPPRRFECTVPPPTISIVASPSPSSYWSAVTAMFSGTTRRMPVPAVVRAFQAPADAVLELRRDGLIDIGPALAPLNPGQYRLFVRPLETSSNTAIAKLDVSLAPPAVTRAAIPNLRPGLYRLQVTTADDEQEEVGSWVVVRIAETAHYAAQRRRFDEIKAGLGDGVSPQAKRVILVAALGALEP
jgi:hypothetical protein